MYLGIFSANDAIYFRATTIDRQGSAIDATIGPDFQVFTNDDSTALISGTMTKVEYETGVYEGSFTALEATYLAGQYFILIDATVDGETPKAHITFQLVSDDFSLEETFQEIQMIGAAIPIVGEGTISIDHNFGATDNYRVIASGTPLADVDIRAFVETDYDAGLRANKYIVGQSRTGTDGRWVSVIRLDPGDYVLEFSKPGQYRTATVDVTITTGPGGLSVQLMGVQMLSDAVIETYQAPSSLKIQSVPAPIYIDHNYKGKDNLRLMTRGRPIEGIDIKIYKKSDYDGGRITEEFVIQRTITNKEGRWERSVRLESGEYVVEFSKPGKFSTSVKVLKL